MKRHLLKRVISTLLCFSIFLTSNPLLAAGFKFKDNPLEQAESEKEDAHKNRLKVHEVLERLYAKRSGGQKVLNAVNKGLDYTLNEKYKESNTVFDKIAKTHPINSFENEIPHSFIGEALQFEFEAKEKRLALYLFNKEYKPLLLTSYLLRDEEDRVYEEEFYHNDESSYIAFRYNGQKKINLLRISTPYRFIVFGPDALDIQFGIEGETVSVVKTPRDMLCVGNNVDFQYAKVDTKEGIKCYAPQSIHVGRGVTHKVETAIPVNIHYSHVEKHDYTVSNGTILKSEGDIFLISALVNDYYSKIEAGRDLRVGEGMMGDYPYATSETLPLYAAITHYGQWKVGKNLYTSGKIFNHLQKRLVPDISYDGFHYGYLGKCDQADQPTATVGGDWYTRLDEIKINSSDINDNFSDFTIKGKSYTEFNFKADGKIKINPANEIFKRYPVLHMPNPPESDEGCSVRSLGSFGCSFGGSSFGGMRFNSFNFSSSVPIYRPLLPSIPLLSNTPSQIQRQVISEPVNFSLTPQRMSLQIGDTLSVVERPKEVQTGPLIGAIARGTLIVGTAAVKVVSKNVGRTGKNKRLKELAKDDKLGRSDRGWIQQEINTKKGYINNPPGKELAHPRGKEAAKGFDHSNSQLKTKADHKLQHKFDNNGKKNKLGCVKEGGSNAKSN
jgi:hypothetical protein